MEARRLPLTERPDYRIGRKLALPLLLLCTVSIAGGALAALAASSSSWTPFRPQHLSEIPDMKGSRLLAEMREEDGYILYRSGPSEEEIQELRRKEEEKEERAWDMLRNMPIIIDRGPRSRPSINRSPELPGSRTAPQ